MIEGQTRRRQFLHVRHGPVLGAIVTKIVNGIVLGDQEHDVGPLGGMDCQGEKKRGKSPEKEGAVHKGLSDGVDKGSKRKRRIYFKPMALPYIM